MKRNISRNDRINDIELLKMARLIDDSEQSICQNISQYICQSSHQQITALSYVHQYYNNPYSKQYQMKKKQKVLCNQFIQLDNTYEQTIPKSETKVSRLSKNEAKSHNTSYASAPQLLVKRKSVEPLQGRLKGILKNTSKSQQQITLKPFFLFLENKKKVAFKRPLSQHSDREVKRKKQYSTNSSLFSSPQSFMHQKLFFQELSN